MADAHPYTSGSGAIVQAIAHFRKSLPQTIDAAVLQKLGIAPNNESYLINILRFVKVIDDAGAVTTEARRVFSNHDDAEFAKGLSSLIKEGYSDLFSLHGGEGAWSLDANKLITFFRNSDQTSEIVGKRQAKTFQTLASLAGHGEIPEAKTTVGGQTKIRPRRNPKLAIKTPEPANNTKDPGVQSEPPVGLTVRIEINLPAEGTQETYDTIFKSIRQNLLK